MKTKGALLWGTKEAWSVEEIELGDPVAHEVQVELAASGLCHSDEHLVTGGSPIPFPAIGGHEGAGVVTKVGPGVTSLQEGDHVVLAFIPACGTCPPCSTGHQNLCDLGALLLGGTAISDGTHRITARGQGVSPMCLLGTFSPYVTVHESSAVKIEPHLPLDKAALVGCGVTTGWGSSTKVADVRPGETVVVVGVGGVGINAVQGAAAAGAKRVVAIDPVPFKREQAMRFGATHTFESAAAAVEGVHELTYGRMAEKAAEGPAGGDLRRRQSAGRHPVAAVDVRRGQAQPRRPRDHDLRPRRRQPGLPGHARRQEPPRADRLQPRRPLTVVRPGGVI